MITALGGSNSYERSHRQKRIVNEFLAEHADIGLERLDGEEASYDKIREALESMPFLASKKLVILRSPSANKQFLENHQQLLDNIPNSTDVLVIEPKPDKRTSYYKYLKKLPGFTPCEELDEAQLITWLVTESKAHDASLNRADANYLVQRVGADQTLLANELAKLASYNPSITKKTINLLSEPSPKSTIFELIESAFSGDQAKTLKLYEEQRRLRVEPPQIIAMLGWQLHVLAVIAAADNATDQQIATEAKLNPFVVRKSRSLASQLGLQRIKRLTSNLVTIDDQSKTSQIDLETMLKRYLLTIS